MCDPVTLGVAMAAKAAGGYMSRSDSLRNAQAEANARNGILATKLGALDGIYGGNKPVFDDLVGSYAPAVQGASLEAAQSKRGNNNAANISVDTPDSIPMSRDAPPAVRAQYAKQMSKNLDYATNYAKGQGRLTGYSDQWFANNLKNQDAARTLNFNDAIARGQKALIGPEQDAAAAASYKAPSPWGAILSGGGDLLGAASGSSNLTKNIGQAGYNAAGGVSGFA